MELELNNSQEIGFRSHGVGGNGRLTAVLPQCDRIAAVTAAVVQRVAAAYLKPSNRTLGLFIPTATPNRATIPVVASVAAIVSDYRGHEIVQAGEAFDASPANIDARTRRSTLASGMRVTLLPKQTRGGRVVAQVTVRFGTEQSLTGKADSSNLLTSMLSRGTTTLTRQQVQRHARPARGPVFVGGGTTRPSPIETTGPISCRCSRSGDSRTVACTPRS